ncbi:MAG TPA: acetyl-CoA carboxylase biotin carboxylase subunit [bacterium]|jgi:acetyl-CoA carboxylase biotin carboxylase subunit
MDASKKFGKVLVANRGEIAVRILKACREMGIATATVYSEADVNALHVQHADESVCVGPPSPLESYLAIDKIIDAAKSLGCDAIHPGYGFLAENSKFANAIVDAGMVFIGPPDSAIKLMGNKIESREAMIKAGIPVTPGIEALEDDFETVAKETEKIGYPILVKAASGGGGKGMRRVDDPSDLKAAMEGASREAAKAFADPTVYIEKFIVNPRHIEFQVLADDHGYVVHVFERECSIQRRHQKIVEETPSVALTPAIRQQMGETACEVARASDYRSAGTVEFLFAPDGTYYFLEMNTRIQVEHPISEMTTGVDLVQEQIRIAMGEKISFRQDEVSQRGHSIEVRIYAEDPSNNFLPQSGPLFLVHEPSGPGIRVDSGIFTGGEVTTYYDPILSKLIVHAPDRKSAINRMVRALKDYTIIGIRTNIPFLIDVLKHPKFAVGETYTDFIPRNMPEWPYDDSTMAEYAGMSEIAAIAAAVIEHSGLGRKVHYSENGTNGLSYDPWEKIGPWEIASGR